MSPHPLLPILQKNNTVTPVNEPSVWQERQANEISKISESIDTNNIEQDIDSIPDMWARPLLFEMALFEPKHVLHKRILGEWRGMLAMFALKEIFNIPIKMGRITLPESKTSPTDFIQTLSRVIPSTPTLPNTNWRNTYVILFNQDAVGMCSPTTLVCSAHSYYNKIRLPWCDGKRLEDPSNKLNDSEKDQLGFWLKELAGNLSQLQPQNDKQTQKVNTLVKLINNQQNGFIHDLNLTRNQQYQLNSLGLNIDLPVFRYLDKPIEKAPPDPRTSQVRLIPSANKTPSKMLLLLDAKIASQWELVPEEVIVLTTTTLRDAISYGEMKGIERTTLGNGERLPNNVEWRVAEDFFSEKLLYVELPDAFPGARRKENHSFTTRNTKNAISPLLPIKKEVFEFLSADDLFDRLTFEQNSRTLEIKIILSLPLSGHSRTKADFRIEKTYDFLKDCLCIGESTPILEVWPNFVIDNWKVYYTYFSRAGLQETFDIEYLTSPLDEFSYTNGENVKQFSEYPEVVFCSYRDGTNSNSSKYLGSLILKQPDRKQRNNTTWKVGVDFGTSSTNICISRNGQLSDARFSASSLLKVTNPASDARVNYLYNNFLPSDDESIPFFSIFHHFQTQNNRETPLLDGHIYFIKTPENFDSQDPTMEVNLKWGTNQHTNRYTRIFLKQICLQISCEIAFNGGSSVEWCISYPTAFRSHTRFLYDNTWKNVLQDTSQSTGLSFNNDNLQKKSESVASGHYFASNYFGNMARNQANFDKGYVCIDIGGGTSDGSGWLTNKQQNPLRLQNSLHFAGRDIFLRPLFHKTRFLRDPLNISDELVKKLEILSQSDSEERFFMQADTIISRHLKERELVKLFTDHKENVDLQKFSQLIALGLSGIIYYIGLSLKYLKEQGNNYPNSLPDIFVGGNGSRLFHWVAGGSFANNPLASYIFTEMLMAGAGGNFANINFQVVISTHPKTEVAKGLVLNNLYTTNPASIDSENNSELCIAGESFRFNNNSHDWKTPIKEEHIKPNERITVINLDNFKNFIDTFNQKVEYLGRQGLKLPKVIYNDALINTVSNEVNQYFEQVSRQASAQAAVVEPLFIVALKGFLKSEAQRW